MSDPALSTQPAAALEDDRRLGAPSGSALYVGHVRHRRISPVRHDLRHGVYQVLLDLDELPALGARVRGLGYNRPGLHAFYDRDHLGSGDTPVRDKLAAWLQRAHGENLGDGKLFLLTNLRVLGYVFNPVSYFYSYDLDGALRCVVAEVNNTFGERYCYLLRDRGEPGAANAAVPNALRATVEKAFHVSPFIGMQAEYRFTIGMPGPALAVHIDEYGDGEKFFDATFTGTRRPLTTATLLGALARYPLLTLRVVGLIHWHALRLWRKGAIYQPKPAAPENFLEDRR